MYFVLYAYTSYCMHILRIHRLRIHRLRIHVRRLHIYVYFVHTGMYFVFIDFIYIYFVYMYFVYTYHTAYMYIYPSRISSRKWKRVWVSTPKTTHKNKPPPPLPTRRTLITTVQTQHSENRPPRHYSPDTNTPLSLSPKPEASRRSQATEGRA